MSREPKFIINFSEFSISKIQKYYKRVRDDLDIISQEIKITVLDLLILKEIKDYKSVNQVFMVLHQKHLRINFRIVRKRLGYLRMMGIIHCEKI